MTNPLQLLFSSIKSAYISVERGFDHTYRRLIGVPTLQNSEITPQLYLGGQYSSKCFEILKKRGVTGIVSLRIRARAGLPDLGEIQFLHLPTIDMTAPSLQNLQKGVEFIDLHLKAGGKVYVHCAAGEGRGPSLVAAYLVSTGLTPEDAWKQISMVRQFIRPNSEQLARMEEFAQRWKAEQEKKAAQALT